MNEFQPKRIDLSTINNGKGKYKNGDGVQANAINEAIEASAYAQDVAQHALDLIKDTQVGSVTLSAYPIGSIYMSINPTDPSILFGGSWQRIQDKFLLSAGSSYSAGSEGGSADAVVVEHNHYGIFQSDTNLISLADGETGGYKLSFQTGSSYRTSDMYTATTGIDGSGKNMPPYLVVYMWQRIG